MGARASIDFKFNDNTVVYEKAQTIATLELEVLIYQRNRLLTLVRNTPESELLGEAFFIDGFQESRAQSTVDVYCSS